MTAKDFQRKMRDRSSFSHMMIISRHATQRVIERDITRRHVLRSLRTGTVDGSPKWDAGKGNHLGRMHDVVAGHSINVVRAITDRRLVVDVVTVRGGR